MKMISIQYFYRPVLMPFQMWLAQQQLSEGTLSSYSNRIAGYLQFCNQIDAPKEELFTAELVQEYICYLHETSVNASTINLTLSALSKYFEYHRASFPLISRAKLKRNTHTLNDEEIQLVLRTATNHSSTKCRAIVFLCFFGGLSAGQCAQLNLSDVLTMGDCTFIRVTAKAKTVKLHSAAELALKEWIVSLSPEKEEEQPLFTNFQGRRISRIGIDYLIKSIGIRAYLVLSARVLSQSGRQYLKKDLQTS